METHTPGEYKHGDTHAEYTHDSGDDEHTKMISLEKDSGHSYLNQPKSYQKGNTGPTPPQSEPDAGTCHVSETVPGPGLTMPEPPQ